MEKVDREVMMQLVSSKPVGMSVREFCKENNLTEAKYFYYRNKLNKASLPSPEKGFTPIRVKNSVESKPGLLASLNLPGGSVLSIYDPSVILSLGQLVCAVTVVVRGCHLWGKSSLISLILMLS